MSKDYHCFLQLSASQNEKTIFDIIWLSYMLFNYNFKMGDSEI